MNCAQSCQSVDPETTFAEKRDVRSLPLSLCVPETGGPVSSIDIDITDDCNLACSYCFRGKSKPQSMELSVAFRAIDWLIAASRDLKSIKVTLFGGEPLLEFEKIKIVVEYGKRRARQWGKRIHFGCTTNATLINDEVIRFWRSYGMGFHTSIDGIPVCHDMHRILASGGGSSILVEPGVKKILDYRPDVCARATVSPDTVRYLLYNAEYFYKLGYTHMAFAMSEGDNWDDVSLGIYAKGIEQLSEFYLDKCRKGVMLYIHHIDQTLERLLRPRPRKAPCGAGLGLLSIAVDGTIWPCHRWRKHGEGWAMGNIFGGFRDDIRNTFCDFNLYRDTKADCNKCPASIICGGFCISTSLEQTGSIDMPFKGYCFMMRTFLRESKRILYTLTNEGNRLFRDRYLYKERRRENEK